MSLRSSVLGAMLLLAAFAGQSHGAIRTLIKVGASEQWYYNSGNALTINGFSIGGVYTGAIENTFTNYPGTSLFGTLQQQIISLSVAGSGNLDLVLKSEVIVAVAGYANDTLIVGDTTALENAALLQFTQPSASVFSVTADPGSAINPILPPAGTVQVNSLVNGVIVASAEEALGGSGGEFSAPVNHINGGKYTLGQELTVADVDSATSFQVSGGSYVLAVPGSPNPVPEPATLAIWGLGLGIAGLVRLRRKK